MAIAIGKQLPAGRGWQGQVTRRAQTAVSMRPLVMLAAAFVAGIVAGKIAVWIVASRRAQRA